MSLRVTVLATVATLLIVSFAVLGALTTQISEMHATFVVLQHDNAMPTLQANLQGAPLIDRADIFNQRFLIALSAIAMVTLLLALLLCPGCLLTSAANHLSDPSFPEQDATVAAISSSNVVVLIRALDGTREVKTTVSLAEAGPLSKASVDRGWHRTQQWSPVAMFEPRSELESFFVVSETGVEKNQEVDVGLLRVPPSAGATFCSYVLMPFCFVVDVATFPLEWLGFIVGASM